MAKNRKNIMIMMALTILSILLTIISIYIVSMSQIGILLFGMPALYLVGYKENNIRRWAYILGCLGQPFWIITTINHHQWGMLLLCCFYSISWANGAHQHWIKPISDKNEYI